MAQVVFQKGYFIDSEGKRIEGLIRNEDWRNNPTRFVYKESEGMEGKEIGIQEAREFGIVQGVRFVRATVDIDYSSNVEEMTKTSEGAVSQLSRQRDPEWKRNQTVFLQVVLDGFADLYYWYGDGLMRFFYSSAGSPIAQLIYKHYLEENKDSRLHVVSVNKPYSATIQQTNEDFRDQLLKNAICGKSGLEQIRKMQYKRDDLRSYFLELNKCFGSLYTDYDATALSTRRIRLAVRPGLNLSSYKIETPTNFSTIYSDFPSAISFRLGAEVEYFVKFSANRWSLIAEPTYRIYSQELKRGTATDKVSYTSLELPLGIRYAIHSTPDSRLFVNASFVLDFPMSSEIAIQGAPTRTVESSSNFAFGAGYTRKKFTVEARVFTSRNLLKDFVAIPNTFSNASIIFGYTLID
jgi:hypothetical protein